MLIRKLFKFEAAHVVRNCNSQRCKYSQHGHSYKVEFMFESHVLTDYGMVIDFGDLKLLKDHVDRFDHAYHIGSSETEEFKQWQKEHNHRWVELPFNPTAENYAIYFLRVGQRLVDGSNFDNSYVYCKSVRVHETDTGYAESCVSDLPLHDYYQLEDVKFSDYCYTEL